MVSHTLHIFLQCWGCKPLVMQLLFHPRGCKPCVVHNLGVTILWNLQLFLQVWVCKPRAIHKLGIVISWVLECFLWHWGCRPWVISNPRSASSHAPTTYLTTPKYFLRDSFTHKIFLWILGGHKYCIVTSWHATSFNPHLFS
jgi:hypothetical protein